LASCLSSNSCLPTSVTSFYSPCFIHVFFFFLSIPPPPTSTLFPYTTLFRSSDSFSADLAPETLARTNLGALTPGVSVNLERAKVDRKSTRLNSSHQIISYAVFCLKKKNTKNIQNTLIAKGQIRVGAQNSRTE